MEIIKEKVCQTFYKGACPECKQEQKSDFSERFVDVLCSACKNKKIEEKANNFLLNATIEELIFESGTLEEIVLKKNGQKIKLFGENEEYGSLTDLQYKILKDD